MGIKHVHTIVLIGKKTKIKIHYYLQKNLYISHTAMYQDHLHFATLKLHHYISLCMFLFCIVYVQNAQSISDILGNV